MTNTQPGKDYKPAHGGRPGVVPNGGVGPSARPFAPSMAQDAYRASNGITCEQRRALAYGIDDPGAWNRLTIDGPIDRRDGMTDYRAQAEDAIAGFAVLGSREDADRTHAWARQLADDWQAEKDALTRQLAAAVDDLRELCEALELAVSDVNELDRHPPGQRLAPATARGYLSIAVRARQKVIDGPATGAQC